MWCADYDLEALILRRPWSTRAVAPKKNGFPVPLVSLCLKANAEMVPKIPSCSYMLLI